MAFLLGLLYFNALLGVGARRTVARRTKLHEDPVSNIDAFTGEVQAPANSMVQMHTGEQQTKFIRAMFVNRFFIICPYLGTLVNERALTVESRYSRDRLRHFTILSGLPAAVADGHMAGNFLYTPFRGNTQVQDLFNLEGAPNEHQSSTGINDCQTTGMTEACVPTTKLTTLTNGSEVSHLILVCSGNTTTIKDCGIPSLSKFAEVFDILDTNMDGFIEESEFEPDVIDGHRASGKLMVRDENFFGEATISAAFGATLLVFGEEPNFISKRSLFAVFIKREFPAQFRWPGGYGERTQHRRRAQHRRRQNGKVVQFGNFENALAAAAAAAAAPAGSFARFEGPRARARARTRAQVI